MTYSLTTASILAVDFKIMPRKVAKTENYGISGMDYGVGLFVLCHAFKAVRRRFKTVTSDDSIYGYFAILSDKLCLIIFYLLAKWIDLS